MVFKNTPANLKLARKMEQAVKRYPGYTAIIDRTWNCGQDIRFEIGTCCALQVPFTVQTFCNDTGYFEIKLRMRKDEFDSTDMLELKHQNLHSNARILFLGVGQINNCPGDAVGDFVRVSGIDFFKHDVLLLNKTA